MSNLRNERGMALIFALLGMLALTILGLGLTGLGLSATTATTNERDTAEALAIADAGVAHAKRLILWQQWTSLTQFLQNGDGTACNGDELAAAPTAPLPAGYPTDPAQFIPAAGRPFGRGSYIVRVCDDDLTDVDYSTTPAPTVNNDPNVDVNQRILVRVEGRGPTGAVAVIEQVIGAAEVPAVIVNGNLSVPGSPILTGSGGAFHSNGTMEVAGNACAQQYYGSVGTVTVSGGSAGTGAGCSNVDIDTRPSSSPLTIPLLNANTYKPQADYCLTAAGTAENCVTGLPILIPTGWSWSSANHRWDGNSSILTGTYWFDANVRIGGSPGSTIPGGLPITLLSTHSINIEGSPTFAPDLTVSGIGIQPVGLTAIANTDLKMSGNASVQYTGIYYARHQLDVSGSPQINGQIMAYNQADTTYAPGTYNLVPLVGGRMAISGSPTINFSGGGIASTRALAWRECRGTTADPCGPLWGGNP